jgi:hypothetical protein
LKRKNWKNFLRIYKNKTKLMEQMQSNNIQMKSEADEIILDELSDESLDSSTAGISSDTECPKISKINKLFDKMSESKPLKIIDSGCGNRYDNILFEPDDDLSKYYQNVRYCKFCRQIESDKVKFLENRKFICKKCASRESNFCRVRNVLVRTFKKLNIDVNTAVKILQEERDKIYKDLPDRKEKVIIK